MVPDISGEGVIDEADYEPMKTAVGKIAIIAATYDRECPYSKQNSVICCVWS